MFYIIKPTHQKKVYVARALINRESELSIMCECHSGTYAETIVEALTLQESLKSADRAIVEAERIRAEPKRAARTRIRATE